MGNLENQTDDDFKMNICIIGNDIDTFYNIINNKKGIKNFWTFEKGIGNECNTCINNYFLKLEDFKKNLCTEKIRECLLIRVENDSTPEINLILDSMNKLSQTQYMPLVLFLIDNYSNETKILIDKKYKHIDSRLIKLSKFSENKEYIEKEIDPILLRFCSIHNELGDRFTYGIGENAEDIDLIKTYYPFNINICCIGRFGQGKSTGVNSILKEYKAKESTKGCSQTKKLTFYQVNDQPIKILDIPGFVDPESVKSAIDKFKECEKEINKIKDKIHIILYFINFCEERTFMDLEAPILEEIVNCKEAKIIFVMTHSNPNMDDEDKMEKIQNINEGLKGVLKNSQIFDQTEPGGFLFANQENVAFVNFHDDKITKFKKFGETELFHMIHKFFILSKDYKEFKNNEELNINDLEERVEILKERARDIVSSNKIGGKILEMLNIIPVFGPHIWVINRNVANKIAEFFGVDSNIKEDIICEIKPQIFYGFTFFYTQDNCEKIIEKCSVYYKENIKKVFNSYEKAAKYFQNGAI